LLDVGVAMKGLMSIPLVGWFIGLLLSSFVSVPFYFVWNSLAPRYFYFLPEVYLDIPFWHCVGLFIIIPIVKSTLNPFGDTNIINKK
jgi:hypothetical protein